MPVVINPNGNQEIDNPEQRNEEEYLRPKVPAEPSRYSKEAEKCDLLCANCHREVEDDQHKSKYAE